MVLFPMPEAQGATLATNRISHCTAAWERLTIFFGIVGCLVAADHEQISCIAHVLTPNASAFTLKPLARFE
jgi:hypothetical protein